jgi:acetyl esterase/lipase
MVTIQVEYRLLQRKSTESPLRCIRDAKSAMRWVRSHADELGIDPNRIAAAGGSAGGHLAACVGLIEGQDDPADDLTVSAGANALVLFNPVYNNGPGKSGWGHQRVGDRYREWSPAHNIREGAPPTLVFLGTQDKLIPVETAEAFQSAMQEVGSRSELMLFEGKGHGFFNYGRDGGAAYRRTLEAMDAFLASLGYFEEQPATATETQ